MLLEERTPARAPVARVETTTFGSSCLLLVSVSTRLRQSTRRIRRTASQTAYSTDELLLKQTVRWLERLQTFWRSGASFFPWQIDKLLY